MTSTSKPTVALVVGRWQLVHKGHEALFRAALKAAGKVVIVVGSAFHARDDRNPFNWQERVKMVEAALSPAERERVAFLPVRDYHDDVRWNTAVRRGMAELVGANADVVVVGHEKDWTSAYLQRMGWPLRPVESLDGVSATDLRAVYFESEDPAAAQAVLEPYVSAGVRAYLQAWSKLPAYKERVREHAAVLAYRKRWPAASYNTADALVRVGDHVLLVRRGGDIGTGLWALPGGFVEKNERFLTAALRELREETNLGLLESSLLEALQGGPALFDAPLRSPRGHIITNAFYFRFGAMAEPPEVRASDDVVDAKWVHLTELAAYEEQMLDDHSLILDHFLDLLD
jgi:bifunctional NMN adenylyltransferase/nudix hydrolase